MNSHSSGNIRFSCDSDSAFYELWCYTPALASQSGCGRGSVASRRAAAEDPLLRPKRSVCLPAKQQLKKKKRWTVWVKGSSQSHRMQPTKSANHRWSRAILARTAAGSMTTRLCSLSGTVDVTYLGTSWTFFSGVLNNKVECELERCD